MDLVKLAAVETADCDELVKQNRDLITGKKSEPQRGSARPDRQATDQRTLVPGSSIIAGLDPQNMNDTSTKVKSIRGGHISDTRRYCQSITRRQSDQVLVIGGFKKYYILRTVLIVFFNIDFLRFKGGFVICGKNLKLL